MGLLFTLAVGKTLIYTPKPFNKQREIVETAKRLTLSRFRSDKRPEKRKTEAIEGKSEGGSEGASEAIEWWELKQESEAKHSDMAEVCFDDDIFLKPGARYCFFPAPGVEAKAYSRAASDEGSGSEDNSTSDKNSDNHSNEDEADANSDVQYTTTTLNPFRLSNETSQLKKIKQEPVLDSEIPTKSEADGTETDSVNHLEITLPADNTDQRPKSSKRRKIYHCDHENCYYSTGRANYLKRHKLTHLPMNQRPKVKHCDHEGCNYNTDQTGNLNKHKQTHLPIDQRPNKLHHCEHEGCNYSTDYTSCLKKHKQTHLPVDQRAKVHQCDHAGCSYSTHLAGNLIRHKHNHLPLDQRARRHQCDHEGCNFIALQASHLKRHKKRHLHANQRLKRKAYGQPPSNKKRKKDNKE